MEVVFLNKPKSITVKINNKIQLIGAGTQFLSEFKPDDKLRIVQRLQGGMPGHDLTLTIESVIDDCRLVIKEDSLAGSGCDIVDDFTIDSFLGYKRMRKKRTLDDLFAELAERVCKIEKYLQTIKTIPL